MNQKITPCLWFDGQAEEAAKFYTSIFPDSEITSVSHYGEAGSEIHGWKPGSVMMVEFALRGQVFSALNGGPHFKFNEAISLQVDCENAEEVDYYWEKLGEGGDPEARQCGWLKDKFGVSWQVVPRGMAEMMAEPDAAKKDRAFSAMLGMEKLDVEAMKRAAAGAG